MASYEPEAVYDVIVLGAGVNGSATAYNLVKKGCGSVLLLEQFSALHTRGSSHGETRITRRAYIESHFVRMMDDAFKMWTQIEQESKTQLYIKTGILIFGPKSSTSITETVKSLTVNGIEHEVLSANEAMLRYPHQLKLPSDHLCVFEKDGGLLLATKAVSAIQRLFTELGGELLDHHRVTEIVPGDTITVKTNKGDFRTKKLVITAGPWAPGIMDKLGVNLPIYVFRAEVFYWKVDHPEHYSANVFPTFALYDLYDFPFYGSPVYEYPGLVKICPLASLEPIDPDKRDEQATPSTEYIKQYVGEYFKDVSTTPSIYEPCVIMVTPDMGPIIDRHPEHSNIIFGVDAGHGFKLAPVTGKLLSELVLELPPSHDLSPFKLERFNSS